MTKRLIEEWVPIAEEGEAICQKTHWRSMEPSRVLEFVH